MSNQKYDVDIIFNGDDGCSKAQCFHNRSNKITVEVYYQNDHECEKRVISLDKYTAIKFAKTLRTEINKIENE